MSNERVSQDMDVFRLQRTSISQRREAETVGSLWANSMYRRKKQREKREQLISLMYNISTIFVHGQGRRDAAKGRIDWIIGLFFWFSFGKGSYQVLLFCNPHTSHTS